MDRKTLTVGMVVSTKDISTARVEGFWSAEGRDSTERDGWPILRALDKFGRKTGRKWVADPTTIVTVIT